MNLYNIMQNKPSDIVHMKDSLASQDLLRQSALLDQEEEESK